MKGNFFFKLLENLIRENVEFVICGGVAAVLHGSDRITYDLDLMVNPENGNFTRLAAALKRMKFKPRAPVSVEDIADPDKRREWIDLKGALVMTFLDERGIAQLDIFLTYPIPYEELKTQSETIELGGIRVYISSIGHLIKAKKAAGRPQDLADIEILERIRKQT
ncbi:MAG: hypothetical protein PHW04_11545 [Candidatus Wallbacteria bacterium]|nr:hypothetical protein [Candidatus Wallbacteria bacterium]